MFNLSSIGHSENDESGLFAHLRKKTASDLRKTLEQLEKTVEPQWLANSLAYRGALQLMELTTIQGANSGLGPKIYEDARRLTREKLNESSLSTAEMHILTEFNDLLDIK